MRKVKKKEERLGPGCKPSIGGLKAFSGKDEDVKKRKRCGKNSGIVHSLNHSNR